MPGQGNDLVLGQSADGKEIVLRHDHRLQHSWIVGNTGAGKSRHLQGLVRQDIRNWPKTRCGLMLIDPHGDTFDGIMAFIAANKLFHLPIVPIDFRRRDQIVSYNVLRQRPAEPSVIIENFVRAMTHVWGQSDTNQTPLFERWALNTLYTLYHEKKTLADAAHLFTPEGRVLTDRIADPMIRRDWMWARHNWREFETVVSSSINRFRRFLLNPMMRSIFGQSDVSLDLGTALDEGQIILVSLATSGGLVSRQNVDLFATLLLSDLQVACDERGKGDDVKPFYCFLDEFWRFLTPTMAENLAAARGFGVGMTMVNQFPRQILNGGDYGARIFDEVMENARTKIVFRLRSRENLELAADQLFMQTFDPMRVKYQHYSTKVVGQVIQYLPSFGGSATTTLGGGTNRSHTSGTNHTLGSNWAHTDSHSHTTGRSWSDTEGETIGSGGSDSSGSQWNEPNGIPDYNSRSRNESHADSRSGSTSRSHTEGGSESETEGESDTHGGSESDGTSEADTSGSNSLWSNAFGMSVSAGPTLFSVFDQEAEQPNFWSIDEQRFLAMKNIFSLQDREAYILAGDMKAPALIRTADVNRPDVCSVCTDLCVGWYQQESGLSLPLDEAFAKVLERDREFNLVTVVDADADIVYPRRRIPQPKKLPDQDEKVA